MLEDCWPAKKDSLIIKPPKKTPLVLRMVVLSLSMICGLYISSVCLSQRGIFTRAKLMKVELIRRPCHDPSIPQSKLPYVHYPEPTIYSREECSCTPVRFFVIVSMQRSGSGWFETLLNSHINVSSNGEIFSVRERMSNISTILRALDKVYNLDWYSSASKNECTAAVGFKWMLNQGLMDHHEEIVKYFELRHISVIFLFRKNLLRRLVSVLANVHDRDAKQINGTHRAHVHSKHEADVLARYKPIINNATLIPDLKQAEEWVVKALECFKSIHHILFYYEDLISNQTNLIEVQNFLQVPHRKLVSYHVKIHTGPLPEQIENWDTIYNALKGTEFESFLHGD